MAVSAVSLINSIYYLYVCFNPGSRSAPVAVRGPKGSGSRREVTHTRELALDLECSN